MKFSCQVLFKFRINFILILLVLLCRKKSTEVFRYFTVVLYFNYYFSNLIVAQIDNIYITISSGPPDLFMFILILDYLTADSNNAAFPVFMHCSFLSSVVMLFEVLITSFLYLLSELQFLRLSHWRARFLACYLSYHFIYAWCVYVLQSFNICFIIFNWKGIVSGQELKCTFTTEYNYFMYNFINVLLISQWFCLSWCVCFFFWSNFVIVNKVIVFLLSALRSTLCVEVLPE